MKVRMSDVLRELRRRDVRFGDEVPSFKIAKALVEFNKYQEKINKSWREKISAILKQIPKEILANSYAVHEYKVWYTWPQQIALDWIKKSTQEMNELKRKFPQDVKFATDVSQVANAFDQLAKITIQYQNQILDSTGKMLQAVARYKGMTRGQVKGNFAYITCQSNVHDYETFAKTNLKDIILAFSGESFEIKRYGELKHWKNR